MKAGRFQAIGSSLYRPYLLCVRRQLTQLLVPFSHQRLLLRVGLPVVRRAGRKRGRATGVNRLVESAAGKNSLDASAPNGSASSLEGKRESAVGRHYSWPLLKRKVGTALLAGYQSRKKKKIPVRIARSQGHVERSPPRNARSRGVSAHPLLQHFCKTFENAFPI